MVSQGPIWGDADREGIILCEKYKFNLVILSAGFIDSTIEQDKEIQRLQRNKVQSQRNFLIHLFYQIMMQISNLALDNTIVTQKTTYMGEESVPKE